MTETATFSPADRAYIRESYRTLEQLHPPPGIPLDDVPGYVVRGLLPRPTYELDDRSWFPPDYFALLEAAGTVDQMRSVFGQRYRAAAADLEPVTLARDIADDWKGYLSGQFGVCLWSVTPESMAAKNRETRRIDLLLGDPAPADACWCLELEGAVMRLDALLRPFTDFDRLRWGTTGRDRYITGVRKRYAAAFAAVS